MSGYGCCYVAAFGREVEDTHAFMPQFRRRRLRIWGLLSGKFRPGCEDMGVVMWQFLGGRLRILGLLVADLGRCVRIWWLSRSVFGVGGCGWGLLRCAFGAGG